MYRYLAPKGSEPGPMHAGLLVVTRDAVRIIPTSGDLKFLIPLDRIEFARGSNDAQKTAADQRYRILLKFQPSPAAPAPPSAADASASVSVEVRVLSPDPAYVAAEDGSDFKSAPAALLKARLVSTIQDAKAASDAAAKAADEARKMEEARAAAVAKAADEARRNKAADEARKIEDRLVQVRLAREAALKADQELNYLHDQVVRSAGAKTTAKTAANSNSNSSSGGGGGVGVSEEEFWESRGALLAGRTAAAARVPVANAALDAVLGVIKTGDKHAARGGTAADSAAAAAAAARAEASKEPPVDAIHLVLATHPDVVRAFRDCVPTSMTEHQFWVAFRRHGPLSARNILEAAEKGGGLAAAVASVGGSNLNGEGQGIFAEARRAREAEAAARAPAVLRLARKPALGETTAAADASLALGETRGDHLDWGAEAAAVGGAADEDVAVPEALLTAHQKQELGARRTVVAALNAHSRLLVEEMVRTRPSVAAAGANAGAVAGQIAKTIAVGAASATEPASVRINVSAAAATATPTPPETARPATSPTAANTGAGSDAGVTVGVAFPELMRDVVAAPKRIRMAPQTNTNTRASASAPATASTAGAGADAAATGRAPADAVVQLPAPAPPALLPTANSAAALMPTGAAMTDDGSSAESVTATASPAATAATAVGGEAARVLARLVAAASTKSASSNSADSAESAEAAARAFCSARGWAGSAALLAAIETSYNSAASSASTGNGKSGKSGSKARGAAARGVKPEPGLSASSPQSQSQSQPQPQSHLSAPVALGSAWVQPRALTGHATALNYLATTLPRLGPPVPYVIGGSGGGDGGDGDASSSLLTGGGGGKSGGSGGAEGDERRANAEAEARQKYLVAAELCRNFWRAVEVGAGTGAGAGSGAERLRLLLERIETLQQRVSESCARFNQERIPDMVPRMGPVKALLAAALTRGDELLPRPVQ